MSILINILLVLEVIVALLMIFVTLMQRPKNEGLGAAFGGGMTDNLFGAQTSNVLASFTRWLGGIFFGLTLLLSILYARNAPKSNIQKELLSKPRPMAEATASPAPATEAKPAAKAPEMTTVTPVLPGAPATQTVTPVIPSASATPSASPASPVTLPSPSASTSPSPEASASPAATPAATAKP